MRFLIQVFTQHGYMDLSTGYNCQTGQDTLIKDGQRKQVGPRSLHANLVSPVTQREPLIAPNMTDPMLLPAEYLSQLCECHYVHESHVFGKSWRGAWWAVFSTAINRVSNSLCFVLFVTCCQWTSTSSSNQTNKQTKKGWSCPESPEKPKCPQNHHGDVHFNCLYDIFIFFMPD